MKQLGQFRFEGHCDTDFSGPHSDVASFTNSKEQSSICHVASAILPSMSSPQSPNCLSSGRAAGRLTQELRPERIDHPYCPSQMTASDSPSPHRLGSTSPTRSSSRRAVIQSPVQHSPQEVPHEAVKEEVLRPRMPFARPQVSRSPPLHGWPGLDDSLKLLGGGTVENSQGTAGWGPPPAPAPHSAAGTSGWGVPPAPPPSNTGWGAAPVPMPNGPSFQDFSPTKAPPPPNPATNGTTSWAQAAQKNIPPPTLGNAPPATGSAPAPPNGPSPAHSAGGGANSGSTVSAQPTAETTPNTNGAPAKKQPTPAEIEKMKEAILNAEGWGGTNVNQDTTWGGDAEKPLPPPPLGRPPNANIGTDVWEANVRHGGQKITKSDSSQAPSAWTHKPSSNYGGYWDDGAEPHGEAPAAAAPTRWSAPQQPNGVGGAGWGPKKEEYSSCWGTSGSSTTASQQTGMGPGIQDAGATNWGAGGPSGTPWSPPGKSTIPSSGGSAWDDGPTGVSRGATTYDDGTSVWGSKSTRPPIVDKAATGTGGWGAPSGMGVAPPNPRGMAPNRTGPTGGMRGARWDDMGGGSGLGGSGDIGWGDPNSAWGPGGVPKKPPPTGSTWGLDEPGASGMEHSTWGGGLKSQYRLPPHRSNTTIGTNGDPHSYPVSYHSEMDSGPISPSAFMSRSSYGPRTSGGGGPSSGPSGPKYAPMSGGHLHRNDPGGPPFWNQYSDHHPQHYKKEDAFRAGLSVDDDANAGPFGSRVPGASSGSEWGDPHDLPGNMPPPYDNNMAGVPGMPGMGPSAPRSAFGGSQQMGFGGGVGSNSIRGGPMNPPGVPPMMGHPPSQSGIGPMARQGYNQQHLSQLFQQIQMAVQAGHLNPAIMNQKMSPQTLLLLNHLLHQIKTLQSLTQQCRIVINDRNAMMQLNIKINQTKQTIASLQNQIAMQQALTSKSQGDPSVPMVPPMPGGGGTFKPIDPAASLVPGMDGLNIGGGHQTRLPVFTGGFSSKDMDPLSGVDTFKPPGMGNPGFGGMGQPQHNRGMGGSTMLPGDSSTWSMPPSSGAGWPDMHSSPMGAHGMSHDVGVSGWGHNPVSSNAGGSSHYNITDLVPEFEPGKPWKGNHALKNAEDDPTLTPGAVRSSLSVARLKEDILTSKPPFVHGSSSGAQSVASSVTSPPPAVSSWSSSGGSTDIWAPTRASGLAPGGKGAVQGSVQNGAGAWGGEAPTGSSGPGSEGTGKWGSPTGSSGPSWGSPASDTLVLKNVSPQLDTSVLKTVCSQHGPLASFEIIPSQGVALVRYDSKEEAAKAQAGLNNCLLSGVTIHADFASESDVQVYTSGAGSGQGAGGNKASDSWATGNSSNPWSSGSGGSSIWPPSGSAPGAASEGRGNPEGDATQGAGALLPNDLLGGETM